MTIVEDTVATGPVNPDPFDGQGNFVGQPVEAVRTPFNAGGKQVDIARASIKSTTIEPGDRRLDLDDYVELTYVARVSGYKVEFDPKVSKWIYTAVLTPVEVEFDRHWNAESGREYT